MPALNPSFASVRTFVDFMDAYRACEGAPTATRNDLRRAWNILVQTRGQASSNLFILYSTINVSQSSVRTTVSKLNQIYRFMGILGYRETIRIMNETFSTAVLNVDRLRMDLVPFSLSYGVVPMAGRGQDRTDERHIDRHRARRGLRTLEALAAPVSPANVSVVNVAATSAAMADALNGFNPFDGISDDILSVLRTEANS